MLPDNNPGGENSYLMISTLISAGITLFLLLALNKFYPIGIEGIKYFLSGQSNFELYETGKTVFYSLVATFFLTTFASVWVFRKPKYEVRLVEGVEIGVASDLKKLEKSTIDEEREKGLPEGLRLGKVQFSLNSEKNHIQVAGQQGSGKTVVLNTLIEQAAERKDHMFIHDLKGDFIRSMPSIVSRDEFIVYGPWNKNSVNWDIGADVDSAGSITEICKDWVPETGGDNAFFSKSAQAVLAGIIMYVLKNAAAEGRKWNWTDLSQALSNDEQEIVAQALEGSKDIESGTSPITSLISGKENANGEVELSKSGLDVISTLASDMQFVHQIARAAKEASEAGNNFSVKRYFKNKEKRIVILRNDMRYQLIGERVFGAFLTVVKKEIIALKDESFDHKGVPPNRYWFFIDEAVQIGKEASETIQAIAAIARSKGGRVVLGYQDEAQFFHLLGQDGGRVQTSLQQTIILGRMSEETAKAVSDRSGTKEVMITYSNQDEEGKENTIKEKRPVIEPQDLYKLRKLRKGMEVIVKMHGQPAKIVVPFPKMKEVVSSTDEDALNPAFENFIKLHDETGSGNFAHSFKKKVEANPLDNPMIALLKNSIETIQGLTSSRPLLDRFGDEFEFNFRFDIPQEDVKKDLELRKIELSDREDIKGEEQ